MEKTNEQIVRDFLKLWASRDVEEMLACFAQDGIYDNVPENRPMEGHEAIGAWLAICFQHLTRIDVEVSHVAVNGEWVLCERLDDHIVDEKHMVLPVMGAIRVVDGKIVMFRDYYCRKTVAELGMGT